MPSDEIAMNILQHFDGESILTKKQEAMKIETTSEETAAKI